MIQGIIIIVFLSVSSNYAMEDKGNQQRQLAAYLGSDSNSFQVKEDILSRLNQGIVRKPIWMIQEHFFDISVPHIAQFCIPKKAGTDSVDLDTQQALSQEEMDLSQKSHIQIIQSDGKIREISKEDKPLSMYLLLTDPASRVTHTRLCNDKKALFSFYIPHINEEQIALFDWEKGHPFILPYYFPKIVHLCADALGDVVFIATEYGDVYRGRTDSSDWRTASSDLKNSKIEWMDCSLDGAYLVILSLVFSDKQRDLTVYDDQFDPVHSLSYPQANYFCVYYSKQKDLIFVARDRIMSVIRVSSKKFIHEESHYVFNNELVKIFEDKKTSCLILLDTQGDLFIWDIDAHKIINTIPFCNISIGAPNFCRQGQYVRLAQSIKHVDIGVNGNEILLTGRCPFLLVPYTKQYTFEQFVLLYALSRWIFVEKPSKAIKSNASLLQHVADTMQCDLAILTKGWLDLPKQLQHSLSSMLGKFIDRFGKYSSSNEGVDVVF